MSKSAIRVFVFAIYLFVLGLNLLVAPNFLLTLFGLHATGAVWIRVFSMLVMILGVYYMQAAKYEFKVFFRATIYGRTTVLVFLLRSWYSCITRSNSFWGDRYHWSDMDGL